MGLLVVWAAEQAFLNGFSTLLRRQEEI